MIPCVVLSPYAGEIAKNVAYAEAAMLWALDNGYSPFASHLLFPNILRDEVPQERALGFAAERVWLSACAALGGVVLCCLDRGISPGMRQTLATAQILRMRVEHIRLGSFWA